MTASHTGHATGRRAAVGRRAISAATRPLQHGQQNRIRASGYNCRYGAGVAAMDASVHSDGEAGPRVRPVRGRCVGVLDGDLGAFSLDLANRGAKPVTAYGAHPVDVTSSCPSRPAPAEGRLASIPGAVIELSQPAVASDASGRDLGRCLAAPYRTTRGPQPAHCAEPPEPCKDPQVITVSLSRCPDSDRALRPC